jgi:hypothetical protein
MVAGGCGGGGKADGEVYAVTSPLVTTECSWARRCFLLLFTIAEMMNMRTEVSRCEMSWALGVVRHEVESRMTAAQRTAESGMM